MCAELKLKCSSFRFICYVSYNIKFDSEPLSHYNLALSPAPSLLLALSMTFANSSAAQIKLSLS